MPHATGHRRTDGYVPFGPPHQTAATKEVFPTFISSRRLQLLSFYHILFEFQKNSRRSERSMKQQSRMDGGGFTLLSLWDIEIKKDFLGGITDCINTVEIGRSQKDTRVWEGGRLPQVDYLLC